MHSEEYGNGNTKVWPLELIAGVLVMILAVWIFAKNDLRGAQVRLAGTASYVKEQCNGYERVSLASETKSLMRMVQSARQIDRILDSRPLQDTPEDEKRLEQYADDAYLTGIVLLDADGGVLRQYHKDTLGAASLQDDLEAEVLLDVARFPEKSYVVRRSCGDGSYVDLAAIGRQTDSSILVVYYHTPKDYVDAFNLSMESLLAGYNLEQDGTIVITRGNAIVASNDSALIGKSTNDVEIVREIKESEQSDRLMQARKSDSALARNFGVMEHGRNCYVYAYMPETDVFSSTPKNMMYVMILYMLVIVAINMIRWKMKQRYQEERMRIQQAYTDDLQNKNRELELAVERADRANAAKSGFLSRVSHDIRTPLNGIIGLLEIDEMHPDDQELIQANHGKILVSANHLLSLINDILQMSKLESGEITLSHEKLNLCELSSEILMIMEQRAAEEGITLKYDELEERFPYANVYGSPLHIRQIFLNIYSNCIKYNKVGGTVETFCQCLGMQDDEVTYRWTIKDTGIGMSEKFLKHLFDPFSQEHSDARSVYNGTGLGMAIVKSLLDKMGGTIEVTSEVGVGSVFVITLSFEIVEQEKETAEEAEEITPDKAEISGLHLLLAEDNELNAEIAQTLLTDAGATITLVSDGQQALLRYRDSAPATFDAILMDVMMPVMDGISATRAIRALDREDAKTIPIIALTANAFDEDARHCLEAGMNAHLSKPLDMPLVIATIAKLCAGKSEK